MTSKAELRRLYASMVEDGEGDLLHAEISECKRLKELYEERLHLLLTRNPALALVREQQDHLYSHYEEHFRRKIAENAEAMEAASEVLDKWRSRVTDGGGVHCV